MPDFFWGDLFLYSSCLLALIIATRYMSSPDNYMIKEEKDNIVWPIIIAIILSVWMANRPLASNAYGDTGAYANGYNGMDPYDVKFSWTGEWFWQWLMVACKLLGLDHVGWFTVVYAIYVFGAMTCVKILMPNKVMLGMVFVWTALMYYTFSINGIRNGMACHMLLIGFAFILKGRALFWPGAGLCLLAFGVHRSTMLPIAAFVVGRFLLKDARYAVYFWLLSIPISLVAGGAVTSFFSGLGFDDRMAGYADTSNDISGFSHSGFRWDFLFYSMWPVVMTWVNCVKRKCTDNWYRVLSVTYCLSNAFWVMVIRASFSNRFAYLSWFLYPIIIAYPLVNIDTWEDQDRKTGYVLLAYAGFTFLMSTVYWG